MSNINCKTFAKSSIESCYLALESKIPRALSVECNSLNSKRSRREVIIIKTSNHRSPGLRTHESGIIVIIENWCNPLYVTDQNFSAKKHDPTFCQHDNLGYSRQI